MSSEWDMICISGQMHCKLQELSYTSSPNDVNFCPQTASNWKWIFTHPPLILHSISLPGFADGDQTRRQLNSCAGKAVTLTKFFGSTVSWHDLQHNLKSRLVGWHRGRTVVFGRRTSPVLRSTCSWRVTTYVGKPSTVGQPTRPTKPFILSRSIN